MKQKNLRMALNTIALYIHSNQQFKKLNKRCSEILNHIVSLPIENNVKNNKIKLVNKLVKNLEILKNYPVKVHKIGYIILNLIWKKIVLSVGFKNIFDTIEELDLSDEFSKEVIFNLKNKDNLGIISNSEFVKNFIHLIKPINCQYRQTQFSGTTLETEIESKSETKNYLILYNIKPSLPTTQGQLYGLCVEMVYKGKLLRIFGIIDADRFECNRKLIDKEKIKKELDKKIPQADLDCYINCISLRDFLTEDLSRLVNKIKHFKEKIDFYLTVPSSVILCEYSFMPENFRIELIQLLLELGLKNKAKDLYMKIPFAIDLLPWKFSKELDSINFSKGNVNIEGDEQSYEFKISNLNVDEKVKEKAFSKLKLINKSDGDSKAQKYLDGLLKIPFGKIKEEQNISANNIRKQCSKFFAKNKNFKQFNSSNPSQLLVNLDKLEVEMELSKYDSEYELSKELTKFKKIVKKSIDDQIEFMKKVQTTLDENIHGHEKVKLQIKRLLAKWISGGQSGMILGLEGPPGNGKTTLIKQGIANCLIGEDGKTRPVGFIPLGGSSNASSLVGHGYTYQGSSWGRLVDILMEVGIMNPILMFDELDKISLTENGREVTGILTHLTDCSQNEEFYDKYFDGIPIDFSKALMVFTFNDRSKIDPILLDRMTIIKTESLRLEDKLIVADKHLIPQITKTINLKREDIYVDTNILKKIIQDYTCEAGARQFKRLLEEIINELNLRKLIDPYCSLRITQEFVEDIFHEKDKITEQLIPKKPLVGQINGLWANSLGMGGVLPIQVCGLIDMDNKFELTGTQGDTMKESMKCARSIAFSLLENDKDKVDMVDPKRGIHIHCPSTSTPKDGPSAGAGITLAIYSYLSKKPIHNFIAITGEIDLRGQITKIGGLDAKLNGAKRAGVKLALIPRENEDHLKILLEKKYISLDDTFKIILVDHISDCLQYVF